MGPWVGQDSCCLYDIWHGRQLEACADGDGLTNRVPAKAGRRLPETCRQARRAASADHPSSGHPGQIRAAQRLTEGLLALVSSARANRPSCSPKLGSCESGFRRGAGRHRPRNTTLYRSRRRGSRPSCGDDQLPTSVLTFKWIRVLSAKPNCADHCFAARAKRRLIARIGRNIFHEVD